MLNMIGNKKYAKKIPDFGASLKGPETLCVPPSKEPKFKNSTRNLL